MLWIHVWFITPLNYGEMDEWIDIPVGLGVGLGHVHIVCLQFPQNWEFFAPFRFLLLWVKLKDIQMILMLNIG